MRRHLRVEIEAYDRIIRAFIPSYEEMLERAAQAVAETRPSSPPTRRCWRRPPRPWPRPGREG